jgi:hypothetical protein
MNKKSIGNVFKWLAVGFGGSFITSFMFRDVRIFPMFVKLLLTFSAGLSFILAIGFLVAWLVMNIEIPTNTNTQQDTTKSTSTYNYTPTYHYSSTSSFSTDDYDEKRRKQEAWMEQLQYEKQLRKEYVESEKRKYKELHEKTMAEHQKSVNRARAMEGARRARMEGDKQKEAMYDVMLKMNM